MQNRLFYPKCVSDLLDRTASLYPDNTALIFGASSISYRTYAARVDALASEIIRRGLRKQPVLVLLPKSIDTLVAFLAVAKSGNFYSILDEKTPLDRVRAVCEKLEPALIISDEATFSSFKELGKEAMFTSEFDSFSADSALLENRARSIIDTDLAYVLFTSGSTGTPKGVAITHKSVIDYTFWVCNKFNLTGSDVFANQAPFYFDNSILDIYSTMAVGAGLLIVPNALFAFPLRVLSLLEQNGVNSLFWVPSVLVYFANTNALSGINLKLKRVLFCGEVMPTKQLNIWRAHMPDALYANLYGPTEITDVCTFYIVNREFGDDEILPIGAACENSEALVFDENMKQIKPSNPSVKGELYVRGSGLSVGYYNDLARTDEVFIQNPLQSAYAERIYRTGDVVAFNELGELICFGRIDSQIKLKGHRIELGEIEAVASAISGVKRSACVFDGSNLALFYEASSELELKPALSKKLASYMVPSLIFRVDKFILNANGKIDRKTLLASLKSMDAARV